MNTKLIMLLSAIFLGVSGISLSFLPAEIAAYMGLTATVESQLVLQILGALYFAFAMLNYMAKGSIIGGIYNRPIAVANFTHSVIGALALIKGLSNTQPLPGLFWLLAGVYAVFALSFGIILFRHPLPDHKA